MVCAHLCTKRFHLIIAGEFAVFKSVGQRDMLMSQNNVQGKQKPFAFSGKTMNLQCSSLVESRGPLGLTRAFVERSKRGCAMHACKVLCAQISLVKVYSS